MSRTRTTIKLDHPEGSVSYSVEEVCKLELDAATTQYVRYQNDVAAHLCASAAHDVMRGHAQRVKITLKADTESSIRKVFGEESDKLIYAIKHPYNSLKHSNDSKIAVTFHPDLVEMTVLQACQEFAWTFGYLTPKMLVYALWIQVANAKLRESVPAAVLKMFESATLEATLFERLTEARAIFDQIESHPEEYANYQESFSIVGKWI